MDYCQEIWARVEHGLDEISEALIFIGVVFWKPGMLFSGAPDTILKKITGGFPVRKRSAHSTHPIFVLEARFSEAFHRVCPCTSKYTPGVRYINAGCVLKQTAKVLERTSFLLEKFAFNLPCSARWIKNLRYLGIVPEECIKEGA